MNTLRLFYPVATVVASCFALASPLKAETTLSGFVFAGTPCDLHPPETGESCVSVLVPISGTISLRAKGSTTRREVRLSRVGTFRETLKSGRYEVRLLNPRVGSQELDRRKFRISPSTITVSTTGGKSGASGYFAVSHRSRPQTPFAGVSDGCIVAK